MSSLRNAVARPTHKERAQPLERQKWGLLEKKKDYTLRARDHNEKRRKLKTLRQKAADRNPDEFYFGMMSTKAGANGAKLGDRGNQVLSQDVAKLLKTQDAGYLRTVAQKVRKERERLEEGLVIEGKEVKALKGESGKKGHTVFVGSKNEQEDFRPDEWFGTSAEGLSKTYNRPRQQSEVASEEDVADDPSDAAKQRRPQRAVDAELKAMKEERASRKKRQREQEARRIRLEAVKARERDLLIAEQALEAQRAKMANNVGGVNKNGVKFKVRERKR
ncbi:hypothetical protein H2201_001376 [Coniosporium apollinis]|uniref:U3 snoRNA-associated protein 11 n=1 Tax=Coniosporium apollinis TaxID=61459 RepID=A0ABQ9P2S4_9PEZI|nr:hypothetical protein H2201_001376 [Coniosporium apollinis]